MFKKVAKKYHSSTFKKSLIAIKSKPLLLLYIILLDAAFFAVFYLLNLVLNKFMPDNPQIALAVNSQSMFIIAMVLLTVLYFVLIILAYSFFSLIVLGNIRKIHSKYYHDLSLFKNMFVLNLLLFIIFFILLTLFNYILVLITNTPIWLASIIFLMMFVVAVLCYAFYNFSHSTFILGHKLYDNMKKSLKNIFSKSYFGIVASSIVFMIIYFGIYLILGLVLEDFILQNYSAYINTSSILTLIVVYVLFTFNRIYFFFVADKKLKKE